MKGQLKQGLFQARVAAQNYYDAYEACNTNPPREAAGNVSVYCQMHNPYGTENLVQELLANGKIPFGVEPVLCAQNSPLSITVEKTTGSINGNTVTVTVVENFGEDTNLQIPIELVKVGEVWKVNSINCPQPSS